MFSALNLRLWRSSVFFLCLVLAAGVFAAPVRAMPTKAGMVISVTQGAVAEDAKEKRALSLRSPIFVGDVIKTNGTGNVQILFNDNSILALSEDGEVVVNRAVYQGSGSAPGSGGGSGASGGATAADGSGSDGKGARSSKSDGGGFSDQGARSSKSDGGGFSGDVGGGFTLLEGTVVVTGGNEGTGGRNEGTGGRNESMGGRNEGTGGRVEQSQQPHGGVPGSRGSEAAFDNYMAESTTTSAGGPHQMGRGKSTPKPGDQVRDLRHQDTQKNAGDMKGSKASSPVSSFLAQSGNIPKSAIFVALPTEDTSHQNKTTNPKGKRDVDTNLIAVFLQPTTTNSGTTAAPETPLGTGSKAKALKGSNGTNTGTMVMVTASRQNKSCEISVIAAGKDSIVKVRGAGLKEQQLPSQTTAVFKGGVANVTRMDAGTLQNKLGKMTASTSALGSATTSKSGETPGSVGTTSTTSATSTTNQQTSTLTSINTVNLRSGTMQSVTSSILSRAALTTFTKPTSINQDLRSLAVQHFVNGVIGTKPPRP